MNLFKNTVCISLYSYALKKGMYPSLLTKVMGKIVGQTGVSNLSRATSLREGKILNSKLEEFCSSESVAHCFTILLLSTHLTSVGLVLHRRSPLETNLASEVFSSLF